MTARRRAPAQALVEAALVIPLLLLIAFGGIGAGRLIQVRMALSSVAREAARTASLGEMPSATSRSSQARRTAEEEGRATGERVAQGLGLRGPIDVNVDADPYQPGGWVTATVRYTVSENDLPLIRSVIGPRIEFTAKHVEPIDRWRGLAP